MLADWRNLVMTNMRPHISLIRRNKSIAAVSSATSKAVNAADSETSAVTCHLWLHRLSKVTLFRCNVITQATVRQWADSRQCGRCIKQVVRRGFLSSSCWPRYLPPTYRGIDLVPSPMSRPFPAKSRTTSELSTVRHSADDWSQSSRTTG